MRRQRRFLRQSVLSRAAFWNTQPSDGVPEYLKAVHDYYLRIGLDLAPEDILATAGGSEALSIALACILDDGDELLVPGALLPELQHLHPADRRHNTPHPHLR